MGKTLKFEGESRAIGQNKDLNLSEKTHILMAGKEIIRLCVEASGLGFQERENCICMRTGISKKKKEKRKKEKRNKGG